MYIRRIPIPPSVGRVSTPRAHIGLQLSFVRAAPHPTSHTPHPTLHKVESPLWVPGLLSFLLSFFGRYSASLLPKIILPPFECSLLPLHEVCLYFLLSQYLDFLVATLGYFRKACLRKRKFLLAGASQQEPLQVSLR